MTRSLNQSSDLITLFAVRILVVAFQKLQQVLKAFNAAAAEGNPLWKEGSTRLVSENQKRVSSIFGPWVLCQVSSLREHERPRNGHERDLQLKQGPKVSTRQQHQPPFFPSPVPLILQSTKLSWPPQIPRPLLTPPSGQGGQSLSSAFASFPHCPGEAALPIANQVTTYSVVVAEYRQTHQPACQRV